MAVCEDFLWKQHHFYSQSSALALGTMARPERGGEWEPFILLMNRKVNRNEVPLFDYAQGDLQSTNDKHAQYTKNNKILKINKKHTVES